MSQSDFGIVFLDDDLSLLSLFQRYFSRKYKTFTTHSVDELLEICKTENIAILIIDYHIQDLNGIEILKSFSQRFPLIRRIMLTGDLDLDIVMNAINQGEVHKFMHKPVNLSDLDKAIKEEFKKFRETVYQTSLTLESFKQIDALKSNSKETDAMMYQALIKLKNKDFENFTDQLINIVENIFNTCSMIINALIDLKTEGGENRDELKSSYLHVYWQNIEKLSLLADSTNIPYLKIIGLIAKYTYFVLEQDFIKAESTLVFTTKFIGKIVDPEIQASFQNFIDHELESIQDRTKMDEMDVLVTQLESFELNKEVLMQQIYQADKENRLIVSAELDYLMVIKNGVTIFTHKFNPEFTTDPVLISNLLLAISEFTKEVFDQRELRTINLGFGSILVQRSDDDLFYVLIVNKDSIFHHLFLEELFKRTREIFKEVAPNTKPNEKQEQAIQEVLHELIGQN